jgi:tRNA nucleotidyltransferase (CCA-adding enzyme)
LLTRIKAPLALVAAVRPLVENHLWHHAAGENPSPTAVRRLARRLSPSNLRDLRLVLLADHFGRPPLVKEATLDRIQRLEIAARNLDLETAAPRPILLGRHLIAAGLKPGPDFGTLLDAAFEAQLDGAFADEAGALRYLKSKLAQISGNDFDATATTPSGPRS